MITAAKETCIVMADARANARATNSNLFLPVGETFILDTFAAQQEIDRLDAIEQTTCVGCEGPKVVETKPSRSFHLKWPMVTTKEVEAYSCSRGQDLPTTNKA